MWKIFYFGTSKPDGCLMISYVIKKILKYLSALYLDPLFLDAVYGAILFVQCSRSCGRADSAFEWSGRPTDAFAHLDAAVTSSHHLLFSRERPSAHVSPEIRFDIARSLSPLLLCLYLQRPDLGLNFLLLGLHEFPFVMPDVILCVSVSFSLFIFFYLRYFYLCSIFFIFGTFISAFWCPLLGFCYSFTVSYGFMLEKRCFMLDDDYFSAIRA